LQALLAIEPTDALDVDGPAFAPKEHVNPSIAVAHARLGDLLDPLTERGMV
jgi:hypothetical protein